MMKDNSAGDNSPELLSSTWNKVARDCNQMGYRDGASDGQDKNYQNSFDIGYEQGFKQAFKLGKQHGILKGKELSSGKPEESLKLEDLQQSRKGGCVICKDPELLKLTTIDEVISVQNEKISATLELIKNQS